MTSVALSEPTPFSGNPIDLVEEIVSANDWAHDRASEEELVVEISGRWCDYRLYFVWQEEICAMHFSCGFDMKVPKGRRAAVYELLALANEKLWLGHFDLSAEDNSPAFRHAVLLRGVGGGERRAGRGSGRYRALRMRALLPGVSARAVGRQEAGRGDGGGDDRPGRRSLRARRHAMGGAARRTRRCRARRTLVLVGCGKMGSALLRGWLAGGAGFALSRGRAGRAASRASRPGRPSRGTARPRICRASPRPTRSFSRSSRKSSTQVLPVYRRWAGPRDPVPLDRGRQDDRRNQPAISARRRSSGPCPTRRPRSGAGSPSPAPTRGSPPAQRRLCDELLAAAGESAWVEDEALLDAVTAVSGSGPAYVFLLIEALAQAGRAAGLPPDLAAASGAQHRRRIGRARPAHPTRARRSCARTSPAPAARRAPLSTC